MADDHDALLARADGLMPQAASDIITHLARELRESQADYLAALDVIARLTTGWDARCLEDDIPHGHVWVREPILVDETDDIGPDEMSDREWRVFCEAAQQATRNTT